MLGGKRKKAATLRLHVPVAPPICPTRMDTLAEGRFVSAYRRILFGHAFPTVLTDPIIFNRRCWRQNGDCYEKGADYRHHRQDGSYLAEFLLEKGYDVHGITRRASISNTARIDHLMGKITLHDGDLSDSSSLIRIIHLVQPDEIYNLAAQSPCSGFFRCAGVFRRCGRPGRAPAFWRLSASWV